MNLVGPRQATDEATTKRTIRHGVGHGSITINIALVCQQTPRQYAEYTSNFMTMVSRADNDDDDGGPVYRYEI